MDVLSRRHFPRQETAAERRLDALHATGLLDAPVEERFDRLTRLARHLLGAPVALVSLLDADRQFFLSAQGLSEPWASLRGTPLSHSFCRSVVETGVPLSVTDAREDPRVVGHPAIEALGVVAYLAMPIALPDGHVVGTLCAIDRVPHAWTARDNRALADLAAVATTEIAAGLRLREQEATTAALRASEERYRALFEVSPQMVWFADPDGRSTYVNQHCLDFLGLPEERVLGDVWTAAVHPDDRKRVQAAWAGAVASGGKYEAEFRLRRAADGTYRWILAKGAPLRGPGGRVERWIGTGTDIDDRRRAETALRELIEALGVAVYTTDTAGRLTFYNEAATAVWGWRPPLGDARWRGAWRLYGPDGVQMPFDEYPMGTGLLGDRSVRSGEAVAERPDGVRVALATYPTPLRDEAGALTGGVNVLVDITERKAAESALAESEERLRLALEAGRLAFWELDLTTGKALRAPFHDEIFGHETPLAEWGYGALMRHVLPEDRPEVERAYETAVVGGLGATVECRIRRADDGEVRWIEVHCQPRRGPDCRVVCLHGVLRDITDRRRTEAALRESEARLRLAQEATGIGTWEWDPDTGETLWTPEQYALFGLDPSRDGPMTQGRFLGEIVHPDDRGKVYAVLRGAAATGATYESLFRARRRCPDSRWETRSVIGRGRRIAQADGSPGRFVGVTVDVTERQAAEARLQKLQAELLHVSRLSAAGEMASALAHELNQPLTAATSAIRAARRMLEASPPFDSPRGSAAEVREAAEFAAEQVLRAGQIVRRLRDFVARGEADKRVEDLRKLVEDAGALALVGAKERGVHVEIRFEAALPSVFVDAIQVQQVLFNLIRNALEAMAAEAAGGGEMRKRRHDLVVTAAPVGPETVEVAVADSGPGLAPEIAGRLFEAFVSTKNGGMGVGLSICRSIIEAHGGRLWAEPNPGGGAVFRFTLPAAPPETPGREMAGEEQA